MGRKRAARLSRIFGASCNLVGEAPAREIESGFHLIPTRCHYRDKEPLRSEMMHCGSSVRSSGYAD